MNKNSISVYNKRSIVDHIYVLSKNEATQKALLFTSFHRAPFHIQPMLREMKHFSSEIFSIIARKRFPAIPLTPSAKSVLSWFNIFCIIAFVSNDILGWCGRSFVLLHDRNVMCDHEGRKKRFRNMQPRGGVARVGWKNDLLVR